MITRQLKHLANFSRGLGGFGAGRVWQTSGSAGRLRACSSPTDHCWSRSSVRRESSGNVASQLGLQNEPNVANLFTAEHTQMRESLRKLVDTEINPYVDQWEKEGQFPAHEVFKKLGDAGFLGVTKPVEFGGMGLDYSYSIVVAEEMGRVRCGSIPMAFGVQTDMATPALARFGSDKLRQQYLAPAIAGDMVTCIGVSEASGGSDVASLKTTAVRRGDDYIINGSKMWITNAYQADWMCLLANTSDGPVHGNKSLIILPMDTPGVQLARKIDKMGMRSSDTAEIYFTDVRVPVDNVIGKENMGFMYQMQQFQLERMYAAISALPALQMVIDETIDYTRQRQAFGQPLLNNQWIHYRLAELQTEVELLKSLNYRAAAKYMQGEDVTMLASMAKYKIGRLCRELIDSCLQFWGGMGFTNDVLVSRLYRDMRLMSIGGGADEVMLSIICKYMDTLPKARSPSSKKN